MRKRSRHKEKGKILKEKSVAIDMNRETRDISTGRYLLRWHTHRLVTKTQNHSSCLLIGGFLFDFSVKKKGKPLCVAVGPDDLWKQAK